MSCPPDDIRESVNKALYGDLVKLVACKTSYDYVLGKIASMVSLSLTREEIIEAAREGGRQAARAFLDAPSVQATISEARIAETEACARMFCAMCQDCYEDERNPTRGWKAPARGEEGHETCSYEAEKIRERMPKEPTP